MQAKRKAASENAAVLFSDEDKEFDVADVQPLQADGTLNHGTAAGGSQGGQETRQKSGRPQGRISR